MTKRKTPFFFTFKGLSNSPIFQYLNFPFHRHFKNHLSYLWHVRVLSSEPCLRTQLPEHKAPINVKPAGCGGDCVKKIAVKFPTPGKKVRSNTTEIPHPEK